MYRSDQSHNPATLPSGKEPPVPTERKNIYSEKSYYGVSIQFFIPLHKYMWIQGQITSIYRQCQTWMQIYLLHIYNHTIMNKSFAFHITTLARMRKHKNVDKVSRQPDQDMNFVPLLTPQPVQQHQHQHGQKCNSSQPCSHKQI